MFQSTDYWCSGLHTCSLSSDCKRQHRHHLVSVGVGVFGRPQRRSGRTSFPFDMKRKCERLQRKKKESRWERRDQGRRARQELVSFICWLPWESCWAGPAAPERRCTERKHITHKVVCLWSACIDAILSFQDHLINNPYSYPLWIFVCVWHAVTLCVRQRCCTCSTHTPTHTHTNAHTHLHQHTCPRGPSSIWNHYCPWSGR